MWIFRPAVMVFSVALGITLAGTAAQAKNSPHHPMSVLNERILQIEDQIHTLRNSLSEMSTQEQSGAAEEIHELTLRLSYLKAGKVHLKDLPKNQEAAFIEYVLPRSASPSKPFQNNGFGNGNQDAPGNSEFNNNAENAGGNN